ncbi:unnamed protein product [Zymoseptoria tritici ST99CH_1A5]|uniref:Zn(2)-C6 fungal-type domain-containing protein n=1 Tax=Zymoseptoria tritici ST99CH_1A5 TaxID=1276529 RepID=A0A1Y6LEI2_ZYMTR|nr:unnamed protein product [Zymoseptoria tritici ST99CH_1A5]
MPEATINYDSQAMESETGASSNKRQKSRHRASIACATCRERRIRCEVPPGERECKQCKRSGAQCVIKNDDERRRPISRAYMTTLTERVALLETLLKENGIEPPPVTYPPKTTRGSLFTDGDESPARPAVPHFASASTAAKHEPTSAGGTSPENDSVDELGSSNADVQRDRHDHDGGANLDEKKTGLVSRLLSTRGHLSFDQLSGRLRWYGGTANCHIYSELDVPATAPCTQHPEQAKRAERCIRTLSSETHDYLMELFWQHYNGVLHVVHQEAFNEDREHGRTQFYSGFLHVCILAMGYRHADKSRPDIQRLALPERESTLHREAKYMLDLELECPGGIPSVAALLILGDSEVGVGRDNPGWMYAGMAMRLCFDIGLHLDSSRAGLSQREIDIRRMTLWACVVYDRYWSLFLGRPLTMKSVDLEIYSLADEFERLGTCMPAGREKSLNTRIYEALIDLMEIGGKIAELADFRRNTPTVSAPDQSAYLRMAEIDRDLKNWTSRLPQDLRYNEENRKNAPFSFYLLHQQYHAVLILLHRPFARYDDTDCSTSAEVTALDNHFSRASRAICTKSAIAMARLFWQHRQKFDGKVIFSIGMQHAGAAATALIAALAYMPDIADRNNNMQYLEVLHSALQDMAHPFQPAERMAAVLNAVMIELRGGPISPSNSTNPARRSSTTLEPEGGVAKRRQTNKISKKASSSSLQSSLSKKDSSSSIQAPTSAPRENHISDVSLENAMLGQQTQAPLQVSTGEYGMLPPGSELSSWPAMPLENVQYQHMLTPSPSNAQFAWNDPHLSSQDFSHQLSQAPALNGGLAPLPNDQSQFLYLPTEEDWNRWQSLPSNGGGSSNGAPGQYPANGFGGTN